MCWGEVKPRLSRPNSSAHVILIVSSRFLKPDAGHKLIHEHCVKSEWLTGNVELLRLPERPEGVAEGELFDHGHPEEIFFGGGEKVFNCWHGGLISIPSTRTKVLPKVSML